MENGAGRHVGRRMVVTSSQAIVGEMDFTQPFESRCSQEPLGKFSTKPQVLSTRGHFLLKEGVSLA